MIETNFMKECENCPHLEVTSNTTVIQSMEGNGYWYTITCVNINKCQDIKAHLRKEMQDDGNY